MILMIDKLDFKKSVITKNKRFIFSSDLDDFGIISDLVTFNSSCLSLVPFHQFMLITILLLEQFQFEY